MSRPSLPDDNHVWGFKPDFMPAKDRPPTDEELAEFGVPVPIASLPADVQAKLAAVKDNAQKLTDDHRRQCPCQSCEQWRLGNITEPGVN